MRSGIMAVEAVHVVWWRVCPRSGHNYQVQPPQSTHTRWLRSLTLHYLDTVASTSGDWLGTSDGTISHGMEELHWTAPANNLEWPTTQGVILTLETSHSIHVFTFLAMDHTTNCHLLDHINKPRTLKLKFPILTI